MMKLKQVTYLPELILLPFLNTPVSYGLRCLMSILNLVKMSSYRHNGLEEMFFCEK